MDIVEDRALLFLGAGASACFDFPNTLTFIAKLKSDLENTLESDMLNNILGIPDFRDVEHVLELLDLLQSINKHPATDLFRQYPTTITFPKGYKTFQDTLNNMKGLREKIIDDIYRQYEFDENKIDKICKTYSPLISALMSLNNDDVPIFTTNYDRVIENFCYKKDISVIDGFKRNDENIEESEWTPELFNQPKNQKNPSIRLFKLHGSLNWRIRRNDDKIVKVATEERTRENSRLYKNNLVIYPAEKSKPEIDPFKTLHEHFQKELMSSNFAIFIGFAFRDEYLNSIMKEYPEKNEIIVVSPHASEHLKTLKKATNLKSKLTPIDASFEDSRVLGEIRKIVDI